MAAVRNPYADPGRSALTTASGPNFNAGQTTQNGVTVRLGSTFGFGDFDLYNDSAGYTQFIVDVYGCNND
ncbi:MAG TPA: hypothetical protein VFU74_11865 [Actinocrinis sp.]|nr:hypothetical protein [Actinocrinis sp.]